MTRTSVLVPHAILLVAMRVTSGCDGCDADDRDTRETSASGATSPGLVDGYEVVAAADDDQDNDRRVDPSLILVPNQPDPLEGAFTLDQAVAGLPVDGRLVAELRTDLGTLLCDLHTDRVPETVANFVGLARGLRPWWDPRAGEWTEGRSLYEETKVSRVVPGHYVQMGDVVGDGSAWVGYELPKEAHPSLRRHDQAGQLAMVSRDSGAVGGQFLLTDGPNPDLDGGAPIFGECTDPAVIERLARVPQGRENRPLTDLVVHRVLIRRVVGGAAEARPLQPGLPEGDDPNRPPRGASPPPSALDLDTQIRSRRRD